MLKALLVCWCALTVASSSQAAAFRAWSRGPWGSAITPAAQTVGKDPRLGGNCQPQQQQGLKEQQPTLVPAAPSAAAADAQGRRMLRTDWRRWGVAARSSSSSSSSSSPATSAWLPDTGWVAIVWNAHPWSTTGRTATPTVSNPGQLQKPAQPAPAGAAIPQQIVIIQDEQGEASDYDEWHIVDWEWPISIWDEAIGPFSMSLISSSSSIGGGSSNSSTPPLTTPDAALGATPPETTPLGHPPPTAPGQPPQVVTPGVTPGVTPPKVKSPGVTPPVVVTLGLQIPGVTPPVVIPRGSLVPGVTPSPLGPNRPGLVPPTVPPTFGTAGPRASGPGTAAPGPQQPGPSAAAAGSGGSAPVQRHAVRYSNYMLAPFAVGQQAPAGAAPKYTGAGVAPAVTVVGTAPPIHMAGAAPGQITGASSAWPAPRPQARPGLVEDFGTASAGFAAAPQAAVAVSGNLGPEPWVFKMPGATRTVQLGCLLDFRMNGTQFLPHQIHEALKLAVQDVLPTLNLTEPVGIKLTCYDTVCMDIAAHHAMKGLHQLGAVGVVGPICSTAAIAAAGIATATQLPLISPSASTPKLSGVKYFFRTVPSDRYQGAVLAELARSKGISRIAVVDDDAAYGQGLSLSFQQAFTAAGGTVRAAYTSLVSAPSAQTAADTVVKAKAAGLDGVFVATNNNQFVADFLRALEKAKLDLPLLSGDASASTEIPRLLDGKYSPLKHLTIVNFAQGRKEFYQRLNKQSPGLTDEAQAGHGYDAMVALLRAYAATAGPKTRTEIAQQIPKQRFDGITGPVAFDSQGSRVPGKGTYIRATFDTNTGRLVLGEPLPIPKI